jgi:hypothetical protein
MGAHCYEARRAGVEVVWLTDHDTRIALCIGGPFVDRFDFEAPDLTTTVERAAAGGRTVRRNVGWSVARRDAELAHPAATLSRERCYAGTQSLCLEAAGGEAGEGDEGDEEDAWRYLVVEFRADSKLHSRPLLAEPAIGLAVYPDHFQGQAEAWLDLVLSEQPPDLRQSRLRYGIWGAPGHEPEETRRATAPARCRSAPRLGAGRAGSGCRPRTQTQTAWVAQTTRWSEYASGYASGAAGGCACSSTT